MISSTRKWNYAYVDSSDDLQQGFIFDDAREGYVDISYRLGELEVVSSESESQVEASIEKAH